MIKNVALLFVLMVMGTSSLSAQSADTIKVIMTKGNIIVCDQGSDHGIQKGQTFKVYKRIAGKLEKIATAETKVIDSQKCAMVLTETSEYFSVSTDDIILQQTTNLPPSSTEPSLDMDLANLGIEIDTPNSQIDPKQKITVRPIGYIMEYSDPTILVEKYGWSKNWLAKIDGRVISEKRLYMICNRPELASAVSDYNFKNGALTAVGVLLMAGGGFVAYKAFNYESKENILGVDIKYNDPQWGLAVGFTVLSAMGGTMTILGMNGIVEHFTDFETAYRAAEEYNNSLDVN
jgi:hypothetical protein